MRPSGRDARAVEAGAADDADAPAAVGAGPQHGEGVVAKHQPVDQASGRAARGQAAVVDGQVGAGQAERRRCRPARRARGRSRPARSALEHARSARPSSAPARRARSERRGRWPRPAPGRRRDQRDVGLGVAAVHRQHRWPGAYEGHRSPPARRPASRSRGRSPRQRRDRRIRPRVEQQHARRRRATSASPTTRSIMLAGVAAGLPVVGVDIPAHGRGSRARRAAPSTRGSSSPSPKGQRNHGRGIGAGGGLDRLGSRLVTRAAHAVVGEQVMRRVEWEWLPIRWPSSAIRRASSRVGRRPAALHEERSPAPPPLERFQQALGVGRVGRVVGVLGVDRERHPQAHSRVVTFEAMANSPGVRPRSSAPAARAAAGRARSRRPGRCRPQLADRRCAQRAVRRLAVLADHQHGRAGGRPARRPAPGRGRGCAARWRTRRQPARPGQLQRAVPELGRLQRFGRQPGRLLERQRAHLGRGAGREPRPTSARLARPSSQARSSSALAVGLGAGGSSSDRAAPLDSGVVAVADQRVRAPPGRRRRSSWRGRAPRRRGCRARSSAARASGFRAPLVIAGQGRRSARAASASASRTSSALSPDWLTQTTSVRSASARPGGSAAARRCRSSERATPRIVERVTAGSRRRRSCPCR